jgi:hypothetical protein
MQGEKRQEEISQLSGTNFQGRVIVDPAFFLPSGYCFRGSDPRLPLSSRRITASAWASSEKVT